MPGGKNKLKNFFLVSFVGVVIGDNIPGHNFVRIKLAYFTTSSNDHERSVKTKVVKPCKIIGGVLTSKNVPSEGCV